MKKQIYSLGTASLVLGTLLFLLSDINVCMAWELPEKVPGNFKGKWYGVHCPKVPKKKMVGLVDGEEAFPDQTIINSWGYKAKPMEEIKDLIPEMYYAICTNVIHHLT